jgi:hypothetical protein
VALRGLASNSFDQGDFAEAQNGNRRCLAASREIGDRGGVALALEYIGVSMYWRGDFAAAQTKYKEGLAVSKEIGDGSYADATVPGLPQPDTDNRFQRTSSSCSQCENPVEERVRFSPPPISIHVEFLLDGTA